MNTWPIQDAEIRFCELLEQCIKNGPQMIIRRADAVAMLVSIAQWNALQARVPRSLKDVLLDPSGPRMDDLPLLEPGEAQWR